MATSRVTALPGRCRACAGAGRPRAILRTRSSTASGSSR